MWALSWLHLATEFTYWRVLEPQLIGTGALGNMHVLGKIYEDRDRWPTPFIPKKALKNIYFRQVHVSAPFWANVCLRLVTKWTSPTHGNIFGHIFKILRRAAAISSPDICFTICYFSYLL